jgi:hypothetical protein
MAEPDLATHLTTFLAGRPAPGSAPVHVNREIAMAATRKSAKRGAAKKRAAAKRPSSRKSPARKSTAKRGARKSAGAKTSGLKRKARKGLKAARGGLNTVIQAGGKTWRSLKSTTAQVVEGVKGSLAGDE